MDNDNLKSATCTFSLAVYIGNFLGLLVLFTVLFPVTLLVVVILAALIGVDLWVCWFSLIAMIALLLPNCVASTPGATTPIPPRPKIPYLP